MVIYRTRHAVILRCARRSFLRSSSSDSCLNCRTALIQLRSARESQRHCRHCLLATGAAVDSGSGMPRPKAPYAFRELRSAKGEAVHFDAALSRSRYTAPRSQDLRGEMFPEHVEHM